MSPIYGRPVTRYLAPLILWILAVIYLVTAIGYAPQARLLPLLVGIALVVMLPIDLIATSETALGRRLRETLDPAAGEEIEDLGGARPQLRALAAMLGFAVALPIVGIALAIPLYIIASLRWLGRKSWVAAVLTGLLVGASIYALFDVALGIALYRGLLFAGT